jgi:hypothetical protein
VSIGEVVQLMTSTKLLVMKTVLAASVCMVVSTSAVLSASVTVAGNSARVAATAAALLLDAGVVPKEEGVLVVLEVENVHCDQNSNQAVDSSNFRAELPTIKCRINSRNERGAQSGQTFGEARAMVELLKGAQATPGAGVEFGDCAMGYCGMFAKTIKCTIDTNKGLGDVRRWSCIFDDGQ